MLSRPPTNASIILQNSPLAHESYNDDMYLCEKKIKENIYIHIHRYMTIKTVIQ